MALSSFVFGSRAVGAAVDSGRVYALALHAASGRISPRRLEPEAWPRLADRLRAVSITSDTVHFIARVAERAIDPIRRALRYYHLSKIRSATGYAMRLFIFRDAVDDAEARAALGDAVSVEQLLEAGSSSVRRTGASARRST